VAVTAWYCDCDSAGRLLVSCGWAEPVLVAGCGRTIAVTNDNAAACERGVTCAGFSMLKFIYIIASTYDTTK
jgi:hypothetical protein